MRFHETVLAVLIAATLAPLSAFATSPTPHVIIEPELIEGQSPVIRAHITYEETKLRRTLSGCGDTVVVSADLLGGIVVGTAPASADIISTANYVSLDLPVRLANRDGIFPSSLRVQFQCQNHTRMESIRVFTRHDGSQRTLVTYEEYREQFDRISDDAHAAVGPQPGERDGEHLLPPHLRGLRCGKGLSCRSKAFRSGGE